MGTVYAFFADGFEEIEAFTAVDTLRRAGLNVEIVSVTPDEIVEPGEDAIDYDNPDPEKDPQLKKAIEMVQAK